MSSLDRRHFIAALTGLGSAILAASQEAFAQQPAPAAPPQQPAPRFGYQDVIKKARDLVGLPYDTNPPALPEALSKLDFDAYRDIRFRADKALLASQGAYRMHMFHPGFLFNRPVIVNIVRDGIAAPVPYSAALFDYGKNKFERALPTNLGFAGFRLHYPLNDPRVQDELISFLGASYFRFLGRKQRYGLSARGLAISTGQPTGEEFPVFREFWIEQPANDADRVVIFALLDSPSATGAYQFFIYPALNTVCDVTATLFMRKPNVKLGIAPLTSMFFIGENDRRFNEDYRPELHDSDGLLMKTGAGEWIWRPLRNPKEFSVSAFQDNNPKGFGLIQRDRIFEHYQDLDLAYELRPSYWVEPRDNWGEGSIELIEFPTNDETNDNITATWVPKSPAEQGREIVYGYRIVSLADEMTMHPGGMALNTYQTLAKALGSSESAGPGTRRFIIDFTGGDLSYYMNEPDKVQIVPTTTNGKILRTFLIPNPKIDGFRAGIDVQLDKGQSTDLRAFLKSGNRALTETWTFPWKAE